MNIGGIGRAGFDAYNRQAAGAGAQRVALPETDADWKRAEIMAVKAARKDPITERLSIDKIQKAEEYVDAAEAISEALSEQSGGGRSFGEIFKSKI